MKCRSNIHDSNNSTHVNKALKNCSVSHNLHHPMVQPITYILSKCSLGESFKRPNQGTQCLFVDQSPCCSCISSWMTFSMSLLCFCRSWRFCSRLAKPISMSWSTSEGGWFSGIVGSGGDQVDVGGVQSVLGGVQSLCAGVQFDCGAVHLLSVGVQFECGGVYWKNSTSYNGLFSNIQDTNISGHYESNTCMRLAAT